MIKSEIKKTVKKYIQVLESDDVFVDKIILYGSHAKGVSRLDSDIDICLVSKKFGKNTHEEGKYLFRKLWELKDANIEPVGYSPKDFYAKNRSPLLNEIRESGVELKI